MELRAKLQTQTPPLLSAFALRPQVYTKYMQSCPTPLSALQDPDYAHFIEHQELYWVSKHLPDIKYMGTEHKTLPTSFSIMLRCANPVWLPFFNELRAHLDWPRKGAGIDHIANFLARHAPTAPPETLEFLRALSTPRAP